MISTHQCNDQQKCSGKRGIRNPHNSNKTEHLFFFSTMQKDPHNSKNCTVGRNQLTSKTDSNLGGRLYILGMTKVLSRPGRMARAHLAGAQIVHFGPCPSPGPVKPRHIWRNKVSFWSEFFLCFKQSILLRNKLNVCFYWLFLLDSSRSDNKHP